MVCLHPSQRNGWRVTFLVRQRLGLRYGQEAGHPAPCRSRTVRDRLPSYGSSVQVALVMGTMRHVVTRQVKQGQVHQPVVGAIAVPVMHF